MFDTDTVEVFNQHFPTTMLLEVERSPALPDYMRERFVTAIWTRSYFVDDLATLLKVTPELAKYRPEFADQLETIKNAKTQRPLIMRSYICSQKPSAYALYRDGTGKSDNEQGQFDDNDWWCSYDADADAAADTERSRKTCRRGQSFYTAAQTQMAQNERKRIGATGDAPKFLADKVMAWARQYPADRRVPEALYIAHPGQRLDKIRVRKQRRTKGRNVSISKTALPEQRMDRKADRRRKTTINESCYVPGAPVNHR
jgi:hypothetical protein